MIGVIADDLTGANDIGIMFAKNGYLAHVYSDWSTLGSQAPAVDVIILNTNSRLDPAEQAYAKVADAARLLQGYNCAMYHNKTCSVLRGNVGVEFDAMLDTLGLDFQPVIVGFPDNGRITKRGLHYVHGQLLAESPFRHDPTHPMLESDLVAVLQKQTKRRVGLIDYEIIANGPDAIRQALDTARKRYNYVIMDVTSQVDLHSIAGAVYEERALGGSSAIAAELPSWMGPSTFGSQRIDLNGLRDTSLGCLVLAGSVTPQTRRQIRYAIDHGYAAYTLAPTELLTPDNRRRVLSALAAAATTRLLNGENVVVHSENEPAQIENAKKAAARIGWSDCMLGRIISEALAETARSIATSCSLKRLVVLGGETSGTICAALGITGNVVLEEIDAGISSGLSLGAIKTLLALKSGSFGADDFVVRAANHLAELMRKY